MCGNPPWDKIKVEDKKWFESQGRADIVNAGTAAQRKKAIANLPTTDPELYQKYTEALANAEAQSRFVRLSGRFDLTATGDIDLYPMFAELCLTFSKEAWGLVLPTGIAVNDSNKAFFSKLIDENLVLLNSESALTPSQVVFYSAVYEYNLGEFLKAITNAGKRGWIWTACIGYDQMRAKFEKK